MDFMKKSESALISWVVPTAYGDQRFSFDRKKIYDFWKDYPEKLSNEEQAIFRNECPYLARLKD